MRNQSQRIVHRQFKSRHVAKTLHILLILCFSYITSSAQSKVDIAITLDFGNDTVRGGENLPFTAAVRNIGTEKATDVILKSGNQGPLNIISGKSDAGTCAIRKDEQDDIFRCKLGDIEPGGSVIIRGVIKLPDIDDDIADRKDLPSGFSDQSNTAGSPDVVTQSVDNGVMINKRPLNGGGQKGAAIIKLGEFFVDAEGLEESRDNNHADTELKLLPSANKAPRLKILSPKEGSTVIRTAGQPLSYTVKIEASDPDGKVVAVKVVEPKHDIRPVGVNEKGYIFEYEGVRYGALELTEYLKKNPRPDRFATPTGNNTYSYTMTDLPYGRNQFMVFAVDDGGRESGTLVRFEVKGDSTIEVVLPKKDQIIAPGSTVVVETVSRVKQASVQDVEIAGDEIGYPEVPVKMELLSKQGNVYRHRIELKDVSEGAKSLYVTLLEETGGYASAQVGFLVREIPKISIRSFKDGDTVLRAEMYIDNALQKSRLIEVSYDIEKLNRFDTYTLLIDGHYHTTLSGDFIRWIEPSVGKHTLQIVATYAHSELELARSPLITIFVK